MANTDNKLTLPQIFNISSHPDDKIIASVKTIKWMIENKDQIATSAFVHVMCSQYENLPRISAERALSKDWSVHPISGIKSPDCSDEWAIAFQSTSALVSEIKTILLERV